MRTLYEDWKLRRERLAQPASPPHVAEQARVFEFLMQRFEGNALALAPVRFELSLDALVKTRTVLLHHHMALGEMANARNVQQAQSRARSILERIAKVDPQASASAPGTRIFVEAHAPRVAPELDAIKSALESGRHQAVDSACRRALAHGHTLPDDAVEFLFKTAQDRDTFYWRTYSNNLLSTLEICGNNSVLRVYAEAWLANERSTSFIKRMEEFLIKNKTRSAIFARSRLGDANRELRTRAGLLVSKLGDLHDIALFQDLLALPELQEKSVERDVYLYAMRVLSGLE
ncbi:MAG TPA: hypothetical protein VKX17_12305 [Planctomycetota bacterium]|nr:hypothetical protein [Planctomycetota bacterium]